MNSNPQCVSEKPFSWRRSSALVALVLVISLLGACGGNEDNGNNKANNSNVANNNNNNNNNNNTAPDCDLPEVLGSEDLNGGVTIEKGCYAVESVVHVNDGLLTLEPGVSIVFSKDAGLEFSGTGAFSAVGSKEEQVFLTGKVEEKGHWKGLHFNETNSPKNKLEHVVLSHGGSGRWHGGGTSQAGIFFGGSSNRLHISNSTFTHNAQAAIVVEDGRNDFKMDDSHFSDNDAPLWIHSNLIGHLSGLSFKDNKNSYIRTGIVVEDLTVAQTWPVFDVPYRVSHTVYVKSTLTLAPGVVVEFEQDQGLDIGGEGRLTAKGTEEDMIRLTGVEEQRAYWRGLYFHDTKSSANALDYVIVEYAGANGWHGGASTAGVYLGGNGVALTVSNSVFKDNAAAGIYADGPDTEVSIASSSFEKNERPMWLTGNLLGGLGADNVFSENDKSYVLIGIGGDPSNISKNQTWVALDVPYRARTRVIVTTDLVLSPGMTIEFEQDVGMQIDGGTLAADASEGDRISFIAAEDETVKGYWQGISFVNTKSSKNIIANADILYGGGAKWHGGTSKANLFLGSGALVSLNDVKIGGSGLYGILVEGGSSITPCSDVTFEDNTDSPTSGVGADACL